MATTRFLLSECLQASMLATGPTQVPPDVKKWKIVRVYVLTVSRSNPLGAHDMTQDDDF